MFCKKCGIEIQDQWEFCQSCGEPIVQKTIENKKENNENLSEPLEIQIKPDVKRKRIFTIKKLGVIIISVIVIISILFLIPRKSDENEILSLTNQLAEALNEGDSEKMISCFEPSVQAEIKAVMGLGSGLSGINLWDLWSLGSIGMSDSTNDSKLLITIYDISITSDTTAVVDISIDYGMMGQDRDSVTCVKIDGKWYFSDKSLF